MPFIPLNVYDPTAPIAGCTNAEVDRQERTVSAASLMLADMAIYSTPDDAQVAMLDRERIEPMDITEIVACDSSNDVYEDKHRAWADQFAKDIVAAGKLRAKRGKGG